MKITTQIPFLLAFTILFFNLGCFSQPDEEPPQQPEKKTFVPPNVSFDGDELIEPMFPVEESSLPAESETASKNQTSALQAHPNAKFAADESVRLPKADDLVPQVDVYVKKLEKNLDDLDGSPRFVDDADTLFRDANALALIALALGLSKEDNPYKKAAPAMIKAAMKLETAKNLDEATKVVGEIKQALQADAGPTTLSWDQKVASLGPMMKAVPNINTFVKRNLRTEAALKKGLRNVIEGSAVLSVIGQGSVPNAADTIKPNAVKEWTAHCIEFRDAALTLNHAASAYEAEKGKFGDVQNAYEALSDSCDSCHKLFYNGEITIE